jgi:phosphatidate cytidylyltransferase
MVTGRGLKWHIGGFNFALIPALALLWGAGAGWHSARQSTGFELVLWALIVTVSAVIGAFFAGRTFGGRKLAPTIQPQLRPFRPRRRDRRAPRCSAASGAASGARLGVASARALVFALAAAIGDLFESWMKRRAGVKDSGGSCPATAACSTGSTDWSGLGLDRSARSWQG